MKKIRQIIFIHSIRPSEAVKTKHPPPPPSPHAVSASVMIKTGEPSPEGSTLTGIVEADGIYVGGKPHKGNGTPTGVYKPGRGTKKIPVVGVIETNGKIKAEIFKNKTMTAKNLNALVRKNVDVKNSVLMTDAFRGYLGIKTMIPHKSFDHAVGMLMARPTPTQSSHSGHY